VERNRKLSQDLIFTAEIVCFEKMTRDFFGPTPEQQNVFLIDTATLQKAQKMIAGLRTPDANGDGVTTRQTFAISNPLLDPTDMNALQKFAKRYFRMALGSRRF
jgi:hypothetical protein